ncbi:MAG: hypothetical protein KatS3mg031_2635 [Chitinophagales bacterium]|nr:MAG: hypothetical protein KatS3mg031_2635 [Chitinophagales bacterium]
MRKGKKKHHLPEGSCPADGCVHEAHHRGMGRRDFLTNLGLIGTGSLLLSGLPLRRLAASPLLTPLLSAAGDRILIVIRLKGGNDGLNTFVPLFDYSRYASYRPLLKIPTSNLISLDAKYAIPDFASDLKYLWDRGMMKVIQNVGYPNSDLSHFASTDIWDSAHTTIASKSGWLGRYLWNENPDFLTNPPSDPLAIQIGGDGNILFFNEDNVNMAMNVIDPEALYQIAQSGALYPVSGTATCYYQDQVDFLKSMINTTFYQSQSIKAAYDAGRNNVTFAGGELGEALALVSRLIQGGLTTPIYMLTLDGFDTHAQQDTRHPELLTTFAGAVRSLFDDLEAGGMDRRVLLMTFSEFGRRVNDNGSLGTDHGTAAPLMVFGSVLNGNGFLGDDVNLVDLDNNGNLKHTVDFRQVYTTILQDWMCVDELTADTLLGGAYSRLALGFDCSTTRAAAVETVQRYHQLRYDNGIPFIVVNLPQSAHIKLEAYDLLGRTVASTSNDYYSAGLHKITFPGIGRWPAGAYAYRLYINGSMEGGKAQKH